jgi:demethylmenaquinone methyltransferase/2-methoxy-6-polyprenyl-1,4-benzoquinol methylase
MSFNNNNMVYGFLAKFYDLFDLIFLWGGKGNPRYGLVEAISDTPQRILDVCVGTAASSIAVATQHPQSQIIGIDISEAMLSVARRKISRKKLTNLELINMSADAMQLADNSFDVVMVSFALHEFENELREKIFKEISRVLKPGGKFLVIDFARQNSPSNRAFMKIWTLIEPSCFSAFLDIDWDKHFNTYGLIFESEKEFSNSKLYVLQKSYGSNHGKK